MRTSERAVVLQAIRHGDKKFVLKLYTRGHGALTVLAVPGKGAAAKIRSSVLQPLMIIDAEIIVRQLREMHRLTEATPATVPVTATSGVTLALAQFLNEVMLKCLREPHPNQALFDLIEYAIHRLTEGESNPDFHLHFLKDLLVHLGLEPHNNRSEQARWFDCREGGFTPVELSYPIGLNTPDSLLFSEFLAESGRTNRYNRAQRRVLLDAFIAYFRFHIPGFGDLKSVSVMKEVLEA
jgi:DNA repair protein RecO (recombination protein O)